MIYGAAGRGHGAENAEETAALLRETRPYLIFTGSVHADPGCELYDRLSHGTFIEPTFGEYLEETERLIEALGPMDCHYFGLHPSNIVCMQGNLLTDRERLLGTVRAMREKLWDHLEDTPVRAGEGAIVG